MKRYIDEIYFPGFLSDFKNIFKIIKESYGEFDLRLRDNYFNIYSQGNSLAKVEIRNRAYNVSINQKFLSNIYDDDTRFNGKFVNKEDYSNIEIKKNMVHPFFQKKYLTKLASNIRKVDYGEEISFEQGIIADNIANEKFIIIDRQVTDTVLRKRRMDLLGLKNISGNKYSFIVFEVKMGNNTELRSDVDEQIIFYMNHIKNNIADWAESYKITYKQLKQIGILPNLLHNEIEIDLKNVYGKLLIGGYSGFADEHLKELEENKKGNYEIQKFSNIIN